MATGSGFPRRDPRREDVGLIDAEFESNSTAKGEGSRMTLKSKRNVTLEHDVSPVQPPAEDTSANHAPSHEQIRRRAYEKYLERDGLPGDALDDWLRAERELQKVAVFKRARNHRERRDRSDSKDRN